MNDRDKAYDQLIDDIREVCEQKEGDLDMWEIEDALTSVRQEYQ